jgi:hypothetical protein
VDGGERRLLSSRPLCRGGFIFAKAKQSLAVVQDNLAHLRRYLSSPFIKAAKRYI